ncbi:uncharacterized protein BP5553_08398 [Venustampulla echinocandica]|uniref:Uncharacterized protein n=1 Tax=Venustampulla echinocandica TaxID=2656787 RepID=A0A370TE34_9HELO|nr:uncharacterized protein BP5553_08398 [Venustampulla echinocandica]RDL32959.1 hypothetical protein BP5553_08398 [Venustampulla echinocandica]
MSANTEISKALKELKTAMKAVLAMDPTGGVILQTAQESNTFLVLCFVTTIKDMTSIKTVTTVNLNDSL